VRRVNLVKLYEELLQVLELLGLTWELIIIEDGSTDSTWNEVWPCTNGIWGLKG
jgi:hypothetical protein